VNNGDIYCVEKCLANYIKILPEIAVYATTRGRCWSECSFSSFYTRSKLILPTRSS